MSKHAAFPALSLDTFALARYNNIIELQYDYSRAMIRENCHLVTLKRCVLFDDRLQSTCELDLI